MIELGLLILIVVRIARAAFAKLTFPPKREWLYVLIGAVVLEILVNSFR